MSGAEIDGGLSTQNRNSALSKQMDKHSQKRWVMISGKSRLGRRSTSSAEDNKEQVGEMILDHQRVTIDEMAYHLSVRLGFDLAIIQCRLWFHKFMQDGFQNNSQENIIQNM
jgi:hypothetical protein